MGERDHSTLFFVKNDIFERNCFMEINVSFKLIFRLSDKKTLWKYQVVFAQYQFKLVNFFLVYIYIHPSIIWKYLSILKIFWLKFSTQTSTKITIFINSNIVPWILQWHQWMLLWLIKVVLAQIFFLLFYSKIFCTRMFLLLKIILVLNQEFMVSLYKLASKLNRNYFFYLKHEYSRNYSNKTLWWSKAWNIRVTETY